MTSASAQRDRTRVRARRRVVRELHPDRGGDPQSFIAALAAVDAAHGHSPGGAGDAGVIVIVRHLRWRRLRATLGRSVHRLTGTRRHYIQL